MAEPRLLQGLMRALQWSAKGYRLVDWLGDAGGQIMICPVRLGSSLIRIVTGSKGMYHGRAKIIMGAAGLLFTDWRFAAVGRLL